MASFHRFLHAVFAVLITGDAKMAIERPFCGSLMASVQVNTYFCPAWADVRLLCFEFPYSVRAKSREGTLMGKESAGNKVHRSLVMEKRLAGAISNWAAGANVSFSEAVRLLCSQGLATWPGSPFAAPFGSSQAVIDEMRRMENRICDQVKNYLDEAVDDILFSDARSVGDCDADSVDDFDDDIDGYDEDARMYFSSPVALMYSKPNLDFDDDDDLEDGETDEDAAW